MNEQKDSTPSVTEAAQNVLDKGMTQHLQGRPKSQKLVIS
jgi:hypothetical protein